MNVALLYPPYARPSYLTRFTMTEALTGIFLGPVLRPHHDVRLVDMRVCPNLEKELGDFVPDAAVVACHPMTHGSLDDTLARLVRLNPQVKILLVAAADYGATHVVERPADYSHPLADAVLPVMSLASLRRSVPAILAAWEAEDEPEVPGLLLQVEHGTWVGHGDADDTIGQVGVPDRTLLGRARGAYTMGGVGDMAYLMTTYGCRFSCRYCTMSKESNDIMTRMLGDVMEELEGITEANVFLADFESLMAPSAMLRLANSIEAWGIRKRFHMLTRADSVVNHPHIVERWKDVGLRWVYLGLDGHSTARLREIGKGSSLATHEAALDILDRLGLCGVVGITVSPDFSREDFAAVRQVMGKLRASAIDVTVETPLVGTRWFDEVEHQLTTRDWSLFDLHHAVLPTRLPLDDFYRELTRTHLVGWRRSAPGLFRHYRLRDQIRNAWSGPGALLSAWRAIRDHAPESTAQLQPTAA